MYDALDCRAMNKEDLMLFHGPVAIIPVYHSWSLGFYSQFGHADFSQWRIIRTS